MKRSSLLVFFTLMSMVSFSQKKANSLPLVSVSGKVIDIETKQALEYATLIFTPVNGKKITGDITDKNGQFNINVVKGTYNITVEFISFKQKKISNKIINSNTDLGTILLEISAESLDEVEIIAKKSTVDIRLDKKIYNVGSDMTVKGGTASDVLDNVPSVTVDVEGNVSLRGNANVRILVNGKPSGLVGLSSTDALRQLPADAIEKVEVITSPSARYDAEGTAGILNIILRKGKAQGLNGSITSTAGNPDYFGGSANFNYRTKKLNFFTNTSYNYRKSPGNSFNNVTYFNELGEISSYRNDDRKYDRKNNRFNTLFGFEYFLTDKSSITASAIYRDSKDKNLSTNISSELDNNQLLTLLNERIEDEDETDNTIEYSLNFTQDFKSEGHKLILDFQYGESTENNSSLITDNDVYPTFNAYNPERIATNEDSKDVLFQGDYVLPIGEDAQFEFGFKADLNKLYSDYLVEDYAGNNQFIKNQDFSNTLDFQENIYAVYTQYGKKINKFSYLLGLRVEKTDLKIDLVGSTENFDKKYSQLFPTVNLGYEFTDTESLTLGYSRRLRRPRSWFLNPFESRLSETYIRTGNIDLDPTYTNSFDLGYLNRWKKITLNTSIYYQHSINNFEFAQIEDMREINNTQTLVIIRKPINLSSQDRYGFELTTNYNPFKWWRISNNFNFFKFVTNGSFDGVSYDSNDISWFNRLNSRISLPGKIDWQTIAMYRGPQERALSKREGILSVNLAFSRDILKEKGTLSLNVNDLLNSRKRKSTDYTQTTTTIGEFQWRERQILLNFTYRFNQKKKRERREYNGGGEEEMFKA